MKTTTAQNLLSARVGQRRVTIGFEAPEQLRALSDARQLLCPGCGGLLILHAGSVRAHHFAHLPGAVCSLPQTEPETEEHRAGKLLLAQWLRERLPCADVILEAYLPETEQRADVLLTEKLPSGIDRRVALEFQCANLTPREWRRRHGLYRNAGIEDLWFLGGSRLRFASARSAGSDGRLTQPSSGGKGSAAGLFVLHTSELERALFLSGAPLLFLDASGEQFTAGALVRFRPERALPTALLSGAMTSRSLLDLDFPWNLLQWPGSAAPTFSDKADLKRAQSEPSNLMSIGVSSQTVWEWLAQRYQVTPQTLNGFFGLPLPGQEAFACEERLWQAAIYYRFVHQNRGHGWWLPTVETWCRAYLPLTIPVVLKRLQSALRGFQELLAAAGMLSLPAGASRKSARVLADLTSLSSPPDRDETLRIMRYRSTLLRDKR